MVRGINRQDIFEDEEDYLQMVSILRALSDRHDEQGLRLPPLSIFYAYCLMSNHLHLLLREQEEEVSDVVKRIGVTYAHYFNKKYERSGHLFQDRFRSEPVDSNSNTFCSTRAVFSRISKEDLRELVYTPVEGSEKILDIDTDCSKPVSDSEIKSFLVDSQGIVNPLMVQSLEKSRRNEVLRTMLSLGAGIRQLSRLTGVSFGVIQKLAK